MVGQALPLTTKRYPTSKVVHSSGGNFVLAGPQAAQANLPEAWGLASVLSLSPKPLSQHIPEAAKQTPLPHSPPPFPHACQDNYSGWSRKLVALWAWAHLISAWACILGIGGMASGSSGVGEEVGARNPLSIWGMNCLSPAKCHHG